MTVAGTPISLPTKNDRTDTKILTGRHTDGNENQTGKGEKAMTGTWHQYVILNDDYTKESHTITNGTELELKAYARNWQDKEYTRGTVRNLSQEGFCLENENGSRPWFYFRQIATIRNVRRPKSTI